MNVQKNTTGPNLCIRPELKIILLLALIANILVLTALPGPSFVGAALLLFLMPGWALLAWVGKASEIRDGWWAQLALSIGLSMVCSTLSGLAVHYIPGPVTRLQVLIACDIAIGAFLLLGWLRCSRLMTGKRPCGKGALRISPAIWVLLCILILAAFYRFTWLGYSEFQGDEALVTWSAARSLTGEDDILFLHGKGPAEIVLPANLWVLTGWFNERLGRFPFALASLTAVLAVYLTGKRFFGLRAGLIAAFLFAINGYFVGFARVVQYQSLVVLMCVLAVYTAYRALEDRLDACQILSALFVGVGLLAHYDAVLILPVILWLWLMRLRSNGRSASRRWQVAGLAMALMLLILAAFYLPMSQDLQFAQMLSYLTGSRLGSNLLNNSMEFLLTSGTVYNSSYYTALLVIVFLGVLWSALRWLPRARYIAALLLILMVSTVLWPEVWQVGRVNLAVVPYALALLLAWLSPINSRAKRTAWLWLAAAMLPYVFVLALPLSHVYVIMPPLILLVAYGLDRLLFLVTHRLARPSWVRFPAYALLFMVLFMLSYYPYLVFVNHSPEFTQAYLEHRMPLYWRPHEQLPHVGLFGFPHQSGWKAVGQWYTTGALTGDHLSNEEEWVTLWYTHFAPRSCYPNASYYFVAENPWDAVSVPQDLIDAEYELVSTVTVEDDPRLHVYAHKQVTAQGPPGDMPLTETDGGLVPLLDVRTIEAAYDEDTAPERFVQNTMPQYVLPVEFGDEIGLLGYDLDNGWEIPPGRRLGLTLYWQAQRSISDDYHVFVQLGNEILWGQSDGVPVCNRLPTSLWRPGKVVVDRHRIDVNSGTPPGNYRLRIGLYLPETGERLVPKQGNAGGDSVVLTEIEVTEDDR